MSTPDQPARGTAGTARVPIMAVTEGPDEVLITAETLLDWVGCASCGVRAQARTGCRWRCGTTCSVSVARRLMCRKRRWRGVDPDCTAKIWREWSQRSTSTPKCGSPPVRRARACWRWGSTGWVVVEANYRVHYSTAADLVAGCHNAAMEGRWATTMRFYAGPRLLIVDKVGYGPIAGEAAAALFQVVAQKWNRRCPRSC